MSGDAWRSAPLWLRIVSALAIAAGLWFLLMGTNIPWAWS